MAKVTFHHTYVLSQNNVGGFYDERFPESSFIIAESRESAYAYAESKGVNFNDECECCGMRWWLSEYESGFHPTNIPTL